MAQADDISYGSNLAYVENLYAAFLRDPDSVSSEWRRYFEGLPRPEGMISKAVAGPSFQGVSIFNPPAPPAPPGQGAAATGPRAARDTEMPLLQERVDQLVRAYRARGHLVARIDPLDLPRWQPRDLDLARYGLTELDPAHYGLTDAHLDRSFSTATIPGAEVLTLRKILERLRNTYCRHIGVEFMHIDELEVREWLQNRMESAENQIELTPRQQAHILGRLTDTVVFEEFVQRKFTGAKTFSLEGAAPLIPLLEWAIERAGDQGVEEIVLSMAHRGRLNVLVNILGKRPREIFHHFEKTWDENGPAPGDVPYHLGYTSTWTTAAGRGIRLTLCFNSSHLEFINPVAAGRVRARQDLLGDTQRERALALMIHGDAAFAGEGIVQETLNLGRLAAYTTGGTVHVIVNNQLGFTTSPSEGRSSVYATDVAKMLQVPIFHVNGDNPEAVVYVVGLAMDFRRAFKRDVIIDLYCYRRRGHNEGDEPSFTQPLMYQAIAKRKLVHEVYLERLLAQKVVTREQAAEIVARRRQFLESELEASRGKEFHRPAETRNQAWNGDAGGSAEKAREVNTGFERVALGRLLEIQTRLPPNFHLHPKLLRGLAQRGEMARGGRALDWPAAEALAFATLAVSGVRVRLSGQDSARGTFSQRHAVFHDVEDDHTYMPLQHLAADQSPVEIYNSPLSEAGVLGFEYGYSLDCPGGLVVWEAQFGDFCNAAQVIVDQFVVSAEKKWAHLSGLVLLLPHGFEGMGPEHSSSRLERFLMLAAEDNIRVAAPSTPAQYFHVLRRQVLQAWRKPLVLLTPKSLLRHPQAVSSLDGLAQGAFLPVIPETQAQEQVRQVLLCSGKIYYELLQEREARRISDVAILRLEELYPLPAAALQSALNRYCDGTPVVWVQEEPENMGAWRYLRIQLGETLFGRWPLLVLSRPASASPATGSHAHHRLEQRRLVALAFEPATGTAGTVRALESEATETLSHDSST